MVINDASLSVYMKIAETHLGTEWSEQLTTIKTAIRPLHIREFNDIQEKIISIVNQIDNIISDVENDKENKNVLNYDSKYKDNFNRVTKELNEMLSQVTEKLRRFAPSGGNSIHKYKHVQQKYKAKRLKLIEQLLKKADVI